MSKLKSDLIQKAYKDNLICKNNHSINWTGTQYLHSENLKCDKCGVICSYCPRRHKLKFSNSSTVDYFSTFTCDVCFKKLNTKDGILYDKDCNLTICPYCFYQGNDIPEILED